MMCRSLAVSRQSLALFLTPTCQRDNPPEAANLSRYASTQGPQTGHDSSPASHKSSSSIGQTGFGIDGNRKPASSTSSSLLSLSRSPSPRCFIFFLTLSTGIPLSTSAALISYRRLSFLCMSACCFHSSAKWPAKATRSARTGRVLCFVWAAHFISASRHSSIMLAPCRRASGGNGGRGRHARGRRY